MGDIWINSLYDTALVSSILGAMKKTNGLWVNNSGAELVVVLPIYYNNIPNDSFSDLMFKQIYDRIDNSRSVKIFSSFYQNWTLRKMVHLKAIKIVGFPPNHEPGTLVNHSPWNSKNYHKIFWLLFYIKNWDGNIILMIG